jgi:hypothetical protein
VTRSVADGIPTRSVGTRAERASQLHGITEERTIQGDSVSDAGGLAGLAEALQLFAAAALTGLLIIGLAAHLLAQAAALAELPEAADGVLDGLAGTDP